MLFIHQQPLPDGLFIVVGAVNERAAVVIANPFDLRRTEVDIVNLAANLTLAAGGRLRRLQTGSINGYLYGLLAAVVVILLLQAALRA